MKRRKTTRYDYPPQVVKAVQLFFLHNYDGISEDEVKQLPPYSVLHYFLQWEGIFGYETYIDAIYTATKLKE